jgi:hypothetical protein
MRSALIRSCGSSKYQSQRGEVLKIGLHMIRQQPVHGLIFFCGGEVRTCIGYDVSPTCARLHSDGLGLLPIDFYVTFDDFLTVNKCRLAWRWQDDVGVIFEGWVDAPLEQLH